MQTIYRIQLESRQGMDEWGTIQDWEKINLAIDIEGQMYISSRTYVPHLPETKKQLIAEMFEEIAFFLKPPVQIKNKARGKTFIVWSRKGECPGCGAGTGSKHQIGCPTREQLLKQV